MSLCEWSRVLLKGYLWQKERASIFRQDSYLRGHLRMPSFRTPTSFPILLTYLLAPAFLQNATLCWRTQILLCVLIACPSQHHHCFEKTPWTKATNGLSQYQVPSALMISSGLQNQYRPRNASTLPSIAASVRHSIGPLWSTASVCWPQGNTSHNSLFEGCWSLVTWSLFFRSRWPVSTVPAKQRFHLSGSGLLLITSQFFSLSWEEPQNLNSKHLTALTLSTIPPPSQTAGSGLSQR